MRGVLKSMSFFVSVHPSFCLHPTRLAFLKLTNSRQGNQHAPSVLPQHASVIFFVSTTTTTTTSPTTTTATTTDSFPRTHPTSSANSRTSAHSKLGRQRATTTAKASSSWGVGTKHGDKIRIPCGPGAAASTRAGATRTGKRYMGSISRNPVWVAGSCVLR